MLIESNTSIQPLSNKDEFLRIDLGLCKKLCTMDEYFMHNYGTTTHFWKEKTNINANVF